MTWRPDLTVAAVVLRDDRFLIVEERIGGKTVFNQPAGHVEDGESIVEAVVRETLEETAWHFMPRYLLGCYLWRSSRSGRTTLRFAICGDATSQQPERRLDHGIIAAHWRSRDELLADSARLRSPLVMRCIDDLLSGCRYELSALAHLDDRTAPNPPPA